MKTRIGARFGSSRNAQVGIGTMIVFIATVLVAAIAAGVLIETSGKLQEKSSSTGQRATDDVSTNLRVDRTVGKRNTTEEAGLRYLHLWVSLQSGSHKFDLSQLKITLQNRSSLSTYSYTTDATEMAPGTLQFMAKEERDEDSSFTNGQPVMTSGDLINLTVDLALNTQRFPPRDEFMIVFLPEIGEGLTANYRTPYSWGINDRIELT